MSSLTINTKWNTEINQVENGEPITGGALGNANIATRQLAENIWYLKDKTKNDLFLKADKATTLAGYGISDAYTKSETDNKLTAKVDKTAVIDVAHGGTGSTDAATARSNLGLGTAATRNVGTASGNVMQVGAFGVGRFQDLRSLSFESISPFIGSGVTSGLLIKEQLNLTTGNNFNGLIMHSWVDSSVNATVLAMSNQGMFYRASTTQGTNQAWGTCYKVLSTQNTSVDGNGFIKAASPIVQLYTDRIELNEEAKLQPITLEKLGVGDYLIKGSLGFAQEGWYIETPKDANGNVLVAVVYEQLANNDISVKTYDYMLNKKGRIVPDLETPLDIPSTRWIDLRLQALPQPDIKPFSKDETVATNAE